MNRWDELVGARCAEVLRALLCKAATIAHAENGARYDAEDLGDDALIYGICTTYNARHIAGCLVEESDLSDVAVCERGRVWWLEIQRPRGSAVRVYFYKAPPGAHSVWDLRLDDAEIKKEFSSSNGHQIELFNRNGGEGNAQLLNVIVVHFGDEVTGLTKLEVGAPYLSGNGIAWNWDERFDREQPAIAHDTGEAESLGDDVDGFPELQLLTPLDSGDPDDIDDETEPPAVPEQPTSEFEALGMRDEDEDEDTGKAEDES